MNCPLCRQEMLGLIGEVKIEKTGQLLSRAKSWQCQNPKCGCQVNKAPEPAQASQAMKR